MAKAQVQRSAARKVKDKWRAKEWYKIVAPDIFNSVQIGETLTSNPENLKGRITEVTAQDLTGDFSKMHIKLKFQVNEVKSFDAVTQFVGHDLTSDYVRRLARRKRSKIDASFDVRTKDNFVIRIKPMAVAEKRIQASQMSQIRNLMSDKLNSIGREKVFGEFVRDMISGDIAKELAITCKPVYPLKKVEIRKSEIMSTAEVTPVETKPEAAMPAEGAPPTEVTPAEPVKEERAEEELPPETSEASETK